MTEQPDIIDLQFGLNQLSGNRDLLIKLLGKFTAEYTDLSVRLKTMHESGDTMGYRQLVHTVKGVSGNLGLNGLHKASKQLETTVLEERDISTDVMVFNQILNSTFEHIEALSSQQDEQQAPPPQEVKVDEPVDSVNELTETLKRNEFLPPEKITELLAGCPFEDYQKQQLSETIGDLDYPEALILIDSYRQ